jgi:hypothetical protein
MSTRTPGLGAARALTRPTRALDAIVGPPAAAAHSTPAQPAKRARRSFQLDAAILEELRDAAVFLSGPPHHATLNGLVEDALRDHLAALRQQLELGDRFPQRGSDPRPGRRAT